MEYWIGYLDQALIFAVFAVSLNVLIGYAGIFSIGSAAFGAFGGYTTALLMLQLDLPAIVALLIGAVVGAAASLVISGPILRLSAEYVMLMTLSLSILTVTVIAASPDLGGQQGLIGLPLPSFGGAELLRPSDYLPWLLLFLVIAVAISWIIAESPLGRLLRAAKDDVVAVRALGKAPLGPQLFTFAVMAGLTAFAGGMLVLYNGIAAPSLFSLDQTMLVFAMVIVGGTASIPGSIVGAVLIIAVAPILQQVLRLRPEDSALIQPVVFGLLLILIMRFRPVGLVPERHRVPKATKVSPSATPSDIEAEPTHIVDAVPEDIVDAVTDQHPGTPVGERAEAVVVVSGIDKSFGGVHAVRDLTLQLRRGEVTALVGPNGAGKSTVFNLITGELRPDAGTVHLGATDITRWTPDRVARAGMVRSFQDLRIFGSLTPMENVMMAGRPRSGENPLLLFVAPWRWRRRERELADAAAEWLTFVGLDAGLRVPTRSLSFAQQKQVAFARVLATGAEIFLLDEPFSGIEGSAAEELMSLIERMRRLGHTICIVEHSIQAIRRLADWGYFMENGTVTAEGPIADLLADPRLAEAYFGSS